MYGSLITILTMAMVAAQSRKAVFYTKPYGLKRKGSTQTASDDVNLAGKPAGLNITTHRVPKPDFSSAQLHVLGAQGRTYWREDVGGGCARVLALSSPGSGSTWLWGLLNARASTQVVKDPNLGPSTGAASGGSASTVYATHTSPTRRLLKLLECTADEAESPGLQRINYDVRGAVVSPVIGAPLVNWTRVSMGFGGFQGGLRIVKFVRTNVVKAAITLVRRKDSAVIDGAPNIRYGTSSYNHRKTYFAEADLALALAFVAQQRLQLDALLGTSSPMSYPVAQQQRRNSRQLLNRHSKGVRGGDFDSGSRSGSDRSRTVSEDSVTSKLSGTPWAQLAASTTAAVTSNDAPRDADSPPSTASSVDFDNIDLFEQLPPGQKVEYLLASATAAPKPWIGRLRGTLDGQGHVSRLPQSREHNIYVLRYEDLQRDERGTMDALYQWLGHPAVAEKVRVEATGKKTSDDLREIVQNLGAVSRFFDDTLALPPHADCPLLLMFSVQAPRVFRDCDFITLKKHSREWLALH